ncbi:Predicted membrane protein [Terribacillus halophilus]|uniref:Predicted membrane protein n=1 Tax=Terribacillus halophilus TaxID=361279 RepID=A0A1G6KV72_9BACI|nr:DUF2306 domain-containing protein [Terribacillus halophilus]SDC34864.1 Predicted membrane protein [Terribacillus halophilus]
MSLRFIYKLLLVFIGIYILFTLTDNYILDHQASFFLEQKINLRDSFRLPVWLDVMYVHVFVACLATLSGAVNFSRGLAWQKRKFHRINGYIYVVSVILVSLTSGYLAPYATGGKLVSVPFNMVNLFWPIITIVAIIHAKKGRLDKHWQWMIRSYVFCFTNMFIHLISSVLYQTGVDYTRSYTIGVYGSIIVNVAIAEAIILYLRSRKSS